MSNMISSAGSFRDRCNHVFIAGDAVYRSLDQTAKANWDTLVATQFFRRLSENGTIVRTTEINPTTCGIPVDNRWAAVLQHERIPVVSYPYEWSFGMLKAAALL